MFTSNPWPEVPRYIKSPMTFADAHFGTMLLGFWDLTLWLFFWNENYQCWTSLRKASEQDLVYLRTIGIDVTAMEQETK